MPGVLESSKSLTPPRSSGDVTPHRYHVTVTRASPDILGQVDPALADLTGPRLVPLG